MTKIQFLLGSFLWLLATGCQSSQQAETASTHSQSDAQDSQKPADVANLEKTVLATHDSVMVDMDELMRLKKAVKLQAAELAGQSPSATLKQQKEQAVVVSDALTKAEDAMMDWMNQYKGDTLAKLDQQKAMAYLKDQQYKVNTMRQLMRKSIADAEAFLK